MAHVYFRPKTPEARRHVRAPAGTLHHVNTLNPRQTSKRQPRNIIEWLSYNCVYPVSPPLLDLTHSFKIQQTIFNRLEIASRKYYYREARGGFHPPLFLHLFYNLQIRTRAKIFFHHVWKWAANSEEVSIPTSSIRPSAPHISPHPQFNYIIQTTKI